MYMVIQEGLLESGEYKFDYHDVMICFTLKGSMSKFFSLTERGFMGKFGSLRNKIRYEKSQAFEIFGGKMKNGTIPLI